MQHYVKLTEYAVTQPCSVYLGTASRLNMSSRQMYALSQWVCVSQIDKHCLKAPDNVTIFDR